MKSVRHIHPLLEKKIVGINSWDAWLRRWNAVHTAEELLSLLEYGFHAGGNLHKDIYRKVSWYLSIADGHRDNAGTYIGSRPDDTKSKFGRNGLVTAIRWPQAWNEDTYSSADLRLRIAQKAWSMVCQHFFGTWVAQQGSMAQTGWFYYWGNRDEDFDLITLLFDFLDPKFRINNLSTESDNDRPMFEDFMRGFISTAWELKTVSPGWNDRPYEKKRSRCESIKGLCLDSRQRLLNMVSALRWERMLLKLTYDPLVLPHLEANTHDTHLHGKRTLEERAAADDESAVVAILLRNRLNVERAQRSRRA